MIRTPAYFATVTVTALSLAFTASQALASGYVEPPPAAPAEVVAPAVSWAGAYAGLSYSRLDGDEMTFANPATGPYAFEEANDWGAFAGYVWQSGNWVYGAELAWYRDDQNVIGFPNAVLSDLLDVSGRVGYAWGAFQLYGLLGLSLGDYNEGVGDWNLSGLHYGVGVEYLVDTHVSLGLQYVVRDLSGDTPSGSSQTVSIDHNSLSLRATYRF